VKNKAHTTDIAEIKSVSVSTTDIENMIFNIRGVQVMIDSDIAALYGIETRALNQAVKRNTDRFPTDFMFQLTKSEFENLKSQFVTSSSSHLISQFVTSSAKGADSDWGGVRKLPYAFTENGIAMLSGVLRSRTAIEVNIRIMRAFTAMRHFLVNNADMFQRLAVVEQNQLAIAAHQIETDSKLDEVFKRLDSGNAAPTQGVFFDGQIFDAYTFVCDLVRAAKRRIVLFDNYVDDIVLTVLDKRQSDVMVRILTKTISQQLQLDINRHNAQYPPLAAETFANAHNRFLCIDDAVYHLGASLKDLGKKWFAFSKMKIATDDLLNKLQ